MKALSDAVEAARKAKGITQEELAHRAKLTVSYVSMLCNDRCVPSVPVLVRIAKELGFSLDAALLKDEPPKKLVRKPRRKAVAA